LHATRGGVSLVYHERAAPTIKCVPDPFLDRNLQASRRLSTLARKRRKRSLPGRVLYSLKWAIY